MFDGPAHESYIALCRELQLERQFEEGDWHVSLAGYVSPTLTGRPNLVTAAEVRLRRALADGSANGPEQVDSAWLPRLDQWLVMLEEAGVLGVDIERLGTVWFATDHDPGTDREGYARRGGTREEAAARLWLAVTGRKVTADA